MQIADAQREMRTAYMGGFAGQLVSGLLWAASGALATWGSHQAAIWFLVLAGTLIYPLTQMSLRLVGRPGKVGPENALGLLGAQVAFVLPLSLPLVGAATLYRPEWFYPAFMIALGAHYLPFIFLYGMPMFGGLAGFLWMMGFVLATQIDLGFTAGAWITAGVLLVFAAIGRSTVLQEEKARPQG